MQALDPQELMTTSRKKAALQSRHLCLLILENVSGKRIHSGAFNRSKQEDPMDTTILGMLVRGVFVQQ